jgi:hypothetical protein
MSVDDVDGDGGQALLRNCISADISWTAVCIGTNKYIESRSEIPMFSRTLIKGVTCCMHCTLLLHDLDG